MKILITCLLLFFNINIAPPDNVIKRFAVPAGYQRITASPGSFGAWLQALPLKPAGTPTKTYKGDIARTDVYTAAVIDMSIGNQDLQQCADAAV